MQCSQADKKLLKMRKNSEILVHGSLFSASLLNHPKIAPQKPQPGHNPGPDKRTGY